MDRGGVRRVLDLLGDGDPDVQKGVVAYLGGLSMTEDTADDICRAWIKSESPHLEAVIRRQGRGNLDLLWQHWAKVRSVKLGAILREKGVPAGDEAIRILSLLKLGRSSDVPMDRGGMRKVFDLLGDTDPDVKKGVAVYAGMLPVTEEAADAIYGVWLKFGSPDLEAVIRSQDRKPSNPSLEALFLLLDNQVQKYLALENEQGERFQEAYALATESFRKRLNDVVLKSGNRRLADAYEKALAGRSDFSSDLFIKARTTAGDDPGLFEATKYMTLTGLLDLCKRWAENGWRPPEERQRKLVERAVAAYPRVGSPEIAADAPAPAGTSDLFVSLRKQNLGDREIIAGLDDPGPFVRMRSLYLGAMRNLLPAGRLERAVQGADWPERLAARLSQMGAASGKDHVEWVNTCAGSGELLTAPVNCTPDEYEYFGRILHATPATAGEFAGRYRALTEILHAFQSVHAAGRIVVGDDDSAQERGAVQMVDVEDAPGDVEF